MARTGLTKAQVRAIRSQLLAEGRHPSTDAVRRALGDTGSKSTIHRYLKELGDEEQGSAARRDDTGRQLLEMVEQLADRLHADSERRLQGLLAEHEYALREKDRELESLRGTVAALSARLEKVESASAGTVPATATLTAARQRHPVRGDGGGDSGESGGGGGGGGGGVSEGFGNFAGMLANSRCGRRDDSAFNIVVSGGRSEILDAAKVRPAGLKFS